MSKFTAKAFVFIADTSQKKRKEIIRHLVKNVGYKEKNYEITKCRIVSISNGFVDTFPKSFRESQTFRDFFLKDHIDCNFYANGDEETAIALFLELAKMREDTDKDQWFITEADRAWVNQGIYSPKGSFQKCLVEDRNMGLGDAAMLLSSICPAHKATHLELAKAVQRGEVKLK